MHAVRHLIATCSATGKGALLLGVGPSLVNELLVLLIATDIDAVGARDVHGTILILACLGIAHMTTCTYRARKASRAVWCVWVA